ncbi:MAG: hypothetical protein HYV97_03795 [Bdellovibrio sp.]|nr:hypothetical protein [Bdellovibrio sp.]
MQNNFYEKLTQMALERSTPFCYGCYKDAPSGRCNTCFSDDMMRHVPGVGVEWGTEWIVQHILETELTPVNLEEAFEESIRQCYPETVKVGWMTLDTASVLREMDPVAWSIALGEWETQESEEGIIVSFNDGGTYYWTHEVEAL